MHLPELDKYSQKKSMFSAWDPRVKIVSCLILILSIARLSSILLAASALLVAITFVLLSKIPFKFILKQLQWVFFFILFFLIIMPFTIPGNSIFQIGSISISEEGIRLACLIAIRAVSMVLLIFPMLGTTEVHRSFKALQKMKVPNVLIQMSMFSYRYIFVFLEMLHHMNTAIAARLFKRKTDIRTLRTIANITGMLFIRGFENTQKIYYAMLARGYTGQLVIQEDFTLCAKDILKAFLVVGVAVTFSITNNLLRL